ncbi:MAG: hypothetical protein Alpg2KO_32240 [Alphaproteobacteria bacterium]
MDSIFQSFDPQSIGIITIVLIFAGYLLARKWAERQTEAQIRAMKQLHVDSDGEPLASNVEAIHRMSPGTSADSMTKSELQDTLALYRHAAELVEKTGPDGELLEDVPDPEGLSKWLDEDSPRHGEVLDPAPVASAENGMAEAGDTTDSQGPIVDAEFDDAPVAAPASEESPEKHAEKHAEKPAGQTSRGMTFKRKPKGLKTRLDDMAETE